MADESGDDHSLNVKLTALIKDFERDITRATKTAVTGMTQIDAASEKTSKRVSDSFNKMGKASEALREVGNAGREATSKLADILGETSQAATFLSGSLKALAGGMALETLVRKMIDANAELAKMGENARRVGLSTDQFQALQFAGQKLGNLSPDTIASGTRALSDKANSEQREGEGELTRLLEANNLKITDRADKLKSVNELLADAARLVQNAASEADKVDIARIFGLSEEWVKALNNGPTAFRAAQAEAVATGQIIDKELVQRAADFDRYWTSSWSNWSKQAKSAAVEAAGWLRQTFAGLVAGTGISNDIDGLRAHIQSLRDQRDNGGRFLVLRGNLDGQIAREEKALAELEDKARETGKKVLTSLMKPEGAPKDGTAPAWAGALTTVDARTAPGGKKTVIPKEPKKDSSTADPLDEYDREERSMERRIRNLGAEAEAIGKNAAEAAKAEAAYRLMDAAKQAGIEITPELTAKVDQLSDAYARAKVKLDEAALKQREFVELQNFAGNSLIDIAKSATKGFDGLRSAIQRLADSLTDAILKAALLGQGPLAGILGTGTLDNGGVGGLIGKLFGGAKLTGFADGGQISGAGTGTSDSMIARVSNGEFIVRASQAQKNLALLQAINSGKLPRFATGGMVGAIAAPGQSISTVSNVGGNVTVSPVINTTVNAQGGGDPAQHQALASQTAAAIEKNVRAVIVDEMMRQMRQGNLLMNVRR